MTKLLFKVEDTFFTSYKEAQAYRDEISTDGFWGVPDIEQIYIEEGCVPHGVDTFEGLINPKLKIGAC